MASRPRIFALGAALLLLVGGGALIAQMEAGDRGIAPIDSSGTLDIDGIHVDVGGKNAADARFNGWRLAQREGFKALWAKMHGASPSDAPNLSDSTLDGLVSSIEVQREQIGPTRYIADLGVLFDRTRAGELLGAGGQVRRSAPMLLIPVTTSGGTATTIELRNAWQRAWNSYRTVQSPVDYVRISGAGSDPLMVNAGVVHRPGRGWWRNILDYYGAANVLVAEVKLDRTYPGGPAKGVFAGYFGPDRRPLGGFTLVAKDSGDVARMMNEGVVKMDAIFRDALAAGIVRGDPSLIIQAPPPPPEEETDEPDAPTGPASVVQLLLSNTDAGSLGAAVGQLRGIPGVTGVNERSVAIGGTSTIFVTYKGDVSALRAALMARGWAVDYSGGFLRISRGAPAPVAAPPAAPPVQPGN